MPDPILMPCTDKCGTLYEYRLIEQAATRLQHGPNREHSRVFTKLEVLREIPPTVPVLLASGEIVAGSKAVMDWLVELHEYQKAL